MDPKRRPTPRAYGFEISDALEAALCRALAVVPEERFPSTGELWDALRSALAMEPTPALAPPVNDPSRTVPTPAPASMLAAHPHRARSHARLFAGLGAIAIVGAAAAGGSWFVARGRGVVSSNPSVTSASATVASAVASASAVVVVPPPPGCPPAMIRIAGGKFFMGSDDKKDEAAERPAHQVTLSPYCIDRTEVTVRQYKACSDKGECKRGPRENDWPEITAREHKIYDPLCTIREPEAKAEHPINCVDWSLAEAFCKASGRRLPTEAEWEFATRGPDGRKYPWGDEPPTARHLNACGKECMAWGRKNNEEVAAMYPADDGFATTAPVGSFPQGASPFGLEDVVGNVWEWAADWYAPYTPGPETDPRGGAGADHVLRGGAWNGGDAAWVRPTYRFKSPPTLRSHGVGFRCAKDLGAPSK
jgi:formylglycine-generating enzyme required for sulfatase activity